MPSALAQLVLPFLLVLAAIFDCFTLKIPNWLTALIALSFFPVALIMGLPAADYLWHVGIAIVTLTVGFALYAANLFGGGDAKMIAASALWFSWPALLPFLVYTALAGGVLAFIMLLWSKLRVDQEIRGHTWVAKVDAIKLNVPYGIAIAAGGILAYPQTWWMAS
jgi:prepilin peptidase CpaA